MASGNRLRAVVPQEVEEAEAEENNGDVPDEVIEELENGDNNEN